MDISLADLEQAINYWRARRPSSGEERALSAEVNALATVYAMMIFERQRTVPAAAVDAVVLRLIESWRQPG
ncbi:MAG: DUF3717 domain-containing protein [Herminiimonas sp.]|nr:DUF3717 domain-containing protein [Herminiimonas sp.]